MTMMQTPLTMRVLMERAALFAPDTEVVSKMRETIHRYTYAELDRRGRTLAQPRLDNQPPGRFRHLCGRGPAADSGKTGRADSDGQAFHRHEQHRKISDEA